MLFPARASGHRLRPCQSRGYGEFTTPSRGVCFEGANVTVQLNGQSAPAFSPEVVRDGPEATMGGFICFVCLGCSSLHPAQQTLSAAHTWNSIDDVLNGNSNTRASSTEQVLSEEWKLTANSANEAQQL